MEVSCVNSGCNIYLIRNKKVMFDFDVAKCLNVTTSKLNENAKESPKWKLLKEKNIESNFRFQLTQDEIDFLKSEFPITNALAMTRSLPWVYTQIGVAHFGTSLRTNVACEMAIKLSEAFETMQKNKLKKMDSQSKLDLYENCNTLLTTIKNLGEFFGTPKKRQKEYMIHAAKKVLNLNLKEFAPALYSSKKKVKKNDTKTPDAAKKLDSKSKEKKFVSVKDLSEVSGVSTITINKILCDHKLQNFFYNKEGRRCYRLTSCGEAYGKQIKDIQADKIKNTCERSEIIWNFDSTLDFIEKTEA